MHGIFAQRCYNWYYHYSHDKPRRKVIKTGHVRDKFLEQRSYKKEGKITINNCRYCRKYLKYGLYEYPNLIRCVFAQVDCSDNPNRQRHCHCNNGCHECPCEKWEYAEVLFRKKGSPLCVCQEVNNGYNLKKLQCLKY